LPISIVSDIFILSSFIYKKIQVYTNIINSVKGLSLFFLFFILSPDLLWGDDDFVGKWGVENIQALQVVQIYTDGFDLFSNAIGVRNSFLEDPLRYTEFNFIDEDLLYITRADGSKLRGFYQVRQNSSINREDFPLYIYLEDKYANIYVFPLKEEGESRYIINYTLELSLRDQLLQIVCIARLYR